MLKKHLLYTLALLILIPCLGFSEIQSVTLTLISNNCKNACNSNLQKQFESVPGIESYHLNQDTGIINISWKNGQKFWYREIYFALVAVGHAAKEVKLIVEGTIEDDGASFTLVSSGDSTRFQLFPPSAKHPFDRPISIDKDKHPFPSSLEKQLKTVSEEEQTVVVQGTLVPSLETSYYNPQLNPIYFAIQSVTVKQTPEKEQ